MHTRFTTLTNELKSLGRIIPEEYRAEKILTRVLPITWESKITVIQESKNIATLPQDKLIENLTAFELRRQTMKMDVPKKERSLALRITEGSDLEDDEMAMITKDFKRSFDALSWLQEHHSSNRRGVGFGNLEPKKDHKSKYLTLPENKICTHYGPSEMEQSKHMTGNKNQFLSLEDFKVGNVSFGNGKEDEIIGIGKGKRVNIIYVVDLSTLSENKLTNLSVLDNDPLIWQLNKLVSKDLVIGLPNIKFKEDKVCEACARGKQGNLIGGTEQRGSDPQTLRKPVHEPVPQQQNIEGTSKGNQLVVKPYKYQSSHPIENIITDPTFGIKTRSSLKNHYSFDAFLSLIEPKNIAEALQDAD
ncbi:uncharacterized protein [Nicotiana tomentosiformis]|uniref:uncharacterized protein n=1 Tax=Nicotiana tomentosiformis TaxID=4098 RepID=UPI00388CBAF5